MVLFIQAIFLIVKYLIVIVRNHGKALTLPQFLFIETYIRVSKSGIARFQINSFALVCNNLLRIVGFNMIMAMEVTMKTIWPMALGSF